MLDFIDNFDHWSELIQEEQCDIELMTQKDRHVLRSCSDGPIIIYALGSTGDVLPMIALASEFLKRGYRVKVFTLTKWQSLLAERGIEYFEHVHPIMDTESGYDSKYNEPILEHSGTLKGAKVLLEAFTPMIQYLLFSVKEATHDARLVILSGSSMSLMDSLEASCIPYGLLFLQPWLATGEYPPPLLGTPFSTTPARKSNRLAWKAYKLMTIGLFQKITEHHRIQIGLRKTKLPTWLTWATDLSRISQEWDHRAKRIPVVTAVSPTLLQEPKDLGLFKHEWAIQPGALSLTVEESGFYIPTDLTQFLASGTSPIYFGYGSMQEQSNVSNIRDQVFSWYRLLRQLNSKTTTIFRAIFSVPRLNMSTLPKAIQHAIDNRIIYLMTEKVAHSELFPHCACVVHHGGAGTSQVAAASGVPSIVVAHFADQPFMGSVLESKGIAPATLKLGELDENQLLNSLINVLIDNSEKFKKSAQHIAKQMASENGRETIAKHFIRYIHHFEMEE